MKEKGDVKESPSAKKIDSNTSVPNNFTISDNKLKIPYIDKGIDFESKLENWEKCIYFNDGLCSLKRNSGGNWSNDSCICESDCDLLEMKIGGNSIEI